MSYDTQIERMYHPENFYGDIDLHEVAGLVEAGQDEDGQTQWLGTKFQWDKYEELVNEEIECQQIDCGEEKQYAD